MEVSSNNKQYSEMQKRGCKMSTQIFISYRRDGADSLARSIYERLDNHGYECFFDKEKLGSGKFNIALYKQIEQCTDFLLILPPNGLDRCNNSEDWVRLEIEYAIEKHKNIIPVMMPGFEFPQKEHLPESLKDLPNYQSLSLNMDFFSEGVQKLEEKYLHSKPRKDSNEHEVLALQTSKNDFSIFIKAAPMIIICFIAYFFLLNNTKNPPKINVSANITIDSNDEITSSDGIASLKNLLFDSNQTSLDDNDNNTHSKVRFATTYDDKSNFEYYLKEAENGDAEAMLKVAICYYNGKGVVKDFNQGFEWAKKSAYKGNSDAMILLGATYSEDNDFNTAINKGFESSFLSEDDFDVEILVDKIVTENEHTETKIEKNDKKAFEWYLKSAEAGNIEGMLLAAISYGSGTGVEKNKEEAQKWFTEVYEQTLKDIDFENDNDLLWLGNFYLMEYFADVNVEEAEKNVFKYFTKYSDSGDDLGLLVIGICYHEGIGTEQNYEKAFEWFNKVADNNASDEYFNDEETEKSQSIKFLKYRPLQKVAMSAVGKCYAEGKGISQDDKKAFEWFLKSAEAGFVEAMAKVGVYYWQGKGVEQDYDQAFNWCLKAADFGNVTAMNTVGKIYYLDEGNRRDYKKALEWFQKAANAGNVDAMKNLSIMYKNGEGISKDDKKAKEWQLKYEKSQR